LGRVDAVFVKGREFEGDAHGLEVRDERDGDGPDDDVDRVDAGRNVGDLGGGGGGLKENDKRAKDAHA
jgi:hypothetical protein